MIWFYKLVQRYVPRWLYLPILRPFLPKAVVLFVQREDGKVLAASRRTDRSTYGLVGGKVDPGETPLIALMREVDEEAAVTPINARAVYEAIAPGEVTYLCTAFQADRVEGEIRSEEGIDIAWVEPSELLSRSPFVEFHRELFRVTGAQDGHRFRA